MKNEIVKYKNFVEYNDYYYFHPGRYLEDFMEEFNFSPEEMALRMDVDKETVNRIVNAEQSVTEDLASKLFKATDTREYMWLGYQDEWDSVMKKAEG